MLGPGVAAQHPRRSVDPETPQPVLGGLARRLHARRLDQAPARLAERRGRRFAFGQRPIDLAHAGIVDHQPAFDVRRLFAARGDREQRGHRHHRAGQAVAQALRRGAGGAHPREGARAGAEADQADLLEPEPGLGEWYLFWRIAVPLCLRSLLSGFALALGRALGEFGATLMVAGNIPGVTQTLPLALYAQEQAGNDHVALVFTILLSVTAMGLVGISDWLANRTGNYASYSTR